MAVIVLGISFGSSTQAADKELSLRKSALKEPKIVYFNYDPTDDSLEKSIKLKVERRGDGGLYLMDEAKTPYAAWYALNGAVNRTDARKLPETSLPAGRWLHLVKFVADVKNVNSDGWRTSKQNAGDDAKFAQSFECVFYIEDGTRPTLKHTEPLWTTCPVDECRIFRDAPQFSLPGANLYGSESLPGDEPAKNLKKVGWNLSENRFRLLYAASVDRLIEQLGVKKPRGIAELSDAELDRAADILSGMLPSRYFAVDFEPSNPAEDAWKWDYDSPTFRRAMFRLSETIFNKHGKYFYSWIGPGIRFDCGGRQYELDGYVNGQWHGTKNYSLDDWLKPHESPQEITGVQCNSFGMVNLGFGYNSITINNDDIVGDGPEKWRSPLVWYLRSLDLLNLKTLLAPAKSRFLCFLWPFEDQPSDAKRSPMTRFKLPGYEGYIRHVDNRVIYPPNLIRDSLVVHLCNPKTAYVNYWLFGSTYNPLATLRYSWINGKPAGLLQGRGGDWRVFEYNGADTPAVPQGDGDYMGKDILGVSAMVQAHEIFGRHLREVCDGSQIRETCSFQYKRGDDPQKMAVWKDDTGEFLRAFKHEQPWVQLWRNPTSGKRILLFQDPFAEPFQAVQFKVSLKGRPLARQAEGNNLYYEILGP